MDENGLTSALVPCHVVVGASVWPARSPTRQFGNARYKTRTPVGHKDQSVFLVPEVAGKTSQSNKRDTLSRPNPNAPNIHAAVPAPHPTSIDRATLRPSR